MKNFLRQGIKLFSKSGLSLKNFQMNSCRPTIRRLFLKVHASQGFKSLYQNLQVRAEGNQLFIEGSEVIDKEHFKKKSSS